MEGSTCIKIFNEAISDYHKNDNVDGNLNNPYGAMSFEGLLYKKNWIDTVQWHLEDIIRDPEINDHDGIKIKRRIDKSNQERTDLVEKIDDWYNLKFQEIKAKPSARLNTESVAWVIDRISILCLKIYHMQEQADRNDASDEHKKKCTFKLEVLLEQERDMITSYSQLLEDIQNGDRVVKVYRQMKMYNDDSLNPILYQKNK